MTEEEIAPAGANDVAVSNWRVEWGATTLVNATGAVMIEIGAHSRTANIGA